MKKDRRQSPVTISVLIIAYRKCFSLLELRWAWVNSKIENIAPKCHSMMIFFHIWHECHSIMKISKQSKHLSMFTIKKFRIFWFIFDFIVHPSSHELKLWLTTSIAYYSRSIRKKKKKKNGARVGLQRGIWSKSEGTLVGFNPAMTRAYRLWVSRKLQPADLQWGCRAVWLGILLLYGQHVHGCVQGQPRTVPWCRLQSHTWIKQG